MRAVTLRGGLEALPAGRWTGSRVASVMMGPRLVVPVPLGEPGVGVVK